MKIVSGGVTAAKGFKAAGVSAEIKYKNRKDVALVYSEVSAKTAGTFTKNIVKAAPVKWDMKIVKERETARAVVLNSGIANACTGALGEEINIKIAKAAAKELNIEVEEVLTASTGVIGMQIPVERIEKGVKILVNELDDSVDAGRQAAEAIMTTDTISKECAVTFEAGGKIVFLGGMSKGSGMIHPDMATMLSVITTDLAISKELLQEALSEDVKKSFNMISVDRDTSTNDTLLIMANGLSENPEITEKNQDYYNFCEALNTVTTTLAKMMAGDGEGAGKLLEVKAVNVKSKEDAVLLSKSIITSNLVKTAVYGSDANWGRILCAMGYSGAEFDPDIVDLYIESKSGNLKLVENGIATQYSEEIATKILSESEVTAIADMKQGDFSATAWGCDLTYDYIKINGDYRS